MDGKFSEWARAAGIRAVRTAAQTALAAVGTCYALGDVDWLLVGSASALAAVISLLTSVAGIPEANGGASPLAKHARTE